MGLAEAAAGLSRHESGHLQKSAGQQVKLPIHLLHLPTDNSGHADAFMQKASLLLRSKGFTGHIGTYKLYQFSLIQFSFVFVSSGFPYNIYFYPYSKK